MVKKFKPIEQSAWVAFARAQQTVLPMVEKDLKKGGFPPLSWYDVLLELERARGGSLRPGELSGRLLLAKFNLSRLLDRMEGTGLIVRKPCPSDSRGSLVHITQKGRSLRARMWPAYYDAVQEYFLGRFGPGELTSLAALLARLKAD